MKVGKQFYPDPGRSRQWLQLVVLKPDTLELISNKSYDCPQATEHPHVTDAAAVQPCVNQLSGDLDALEKGYPGQSPIVIAVSQRPDGPIARTQAWQTQPPIGAQEILYKIGAPPTVPWQHGDQALLRGRVSMIGRIGGKIAATRHNNVDLADLSDDGEIRGFLLSDNLGEYSTFESGEMVPFDTQAKGSTGQTSLIRIGWQKSEMSYNPAESFGGFHVTFVDRRDFSATGDFFNTGARPGGALSGRLEVLSMIGAITSATNQARYPDGVLVFIKSVGSPQVRVGTGLPADGEAKQLVDLLTEQLGATRNRVYRALDPSTTNDWSYQLIAKAGTGPGEGLEAEGTKQGDLNGVPAVGFLNRSSLDYGFDLESSETRGTAGGPGERLRQIALSMPGGWPEQGNPGRTAAVVGITGKAGLDTRRSLYWTQPYSKEFWDGKSTKIAGLTCPKDGNFSCAGDFAWAKQELIDEIGWLEAAHGYVSTLAEPFLRTELSAWSDVTQIAANINNKVQAPATDKTLLEVGLLFQTADEFAAELPLVGKAFGAVTDVYKLGLEWAKIDAEGTEAAEPFEVAVADVGTQLTKRLQAVQDTLEHQLVNVIAADYTKLRTVGLCGGLDPSCPDPPLDQWQFTSNDQGKAEVAVEAGVQVSVYAALLPARFQPWAPAIGPNRSTNWSGNQPAGQTILGWDCASTTNRRRRSWRSRFAATSTTRGAARTSGR